jgi:hypothetical protein
MILKNTILIFLYSTLIGSSYACLDPLKFTIIDCNSLGFIKENNLALSSADQALSKVVRFEDPRILVPEMNELFAEPFAVIHIESDMESYESGRNAFDHIVRSSTPKDVQFNIVYETMVSVTFEPWNKIWVIDHFMFEYITDKYRNAFTMLTLKINII